MSESIYLPILLFLCKIVDCSGNGSHMENWQLAQLVRNLRLATGWQADENSEKEAGK